MFDLVRGQNRSKFFILIAKKNSRESRNPFGSINKTHQLLLQINDSIFVCENGVVRFKNDLGYARDTCLEGYRK